MIGADRFIEKLDKPAQTKHATQRYLRGYSDIDMWNFDTFLADAIVAGCDWYIANAATTPWNLDKETWNAALTEIRDGFLERSSDGAPKPSKRTWKVLRKHFRYFWD